jgi:hypothetical protein
MATKKTGQSLKKAQWERGYSSHGYWLGKEKLGDVRQSPKGEGDPRYLWQAGNRAGEAMTLVDAKRMVETLTEQGVKQLGLFED